ncbi:MAG TPA: hypothetical protein VKP65_01585 [Rhodothermales bacterium]|nr:hypothetical protein [Rhodothermales bacterium]
MPEEQDLSRDVLQAFATSFGVDPEEALVETNRLTLNDVRRFLIPRITHLLDRNPPLLMHILYRVDVAESDVKHIFAESQTDAIPADLADLLIERQLQKLRFRQG